MQTNDNRRQLRNHSTPAEATLWKMLRNKQVAALRFRRQHAVGPYILDFYCPAINLGIELDGQVHFNPRAQKKDLKRTKYINEKTGINILRFENKVVFKYPEMIITAIEEYAEKYDELSHPILPLQRGSTPKGGGGLPGV